MAVPPPPPPHASCTADAASVAARSLGGRALCSVSPARFAGSSFTCAKHARLSCRWSLVVNGLSAICRATYTLRKICGAVRFAEVKEEAMLAWPGDTQQNVQPTTSSAAAIIKILRKTGVTAGMAKRS